MSTDKHKIVDRLHQVQEFVHNAQSSLGDLKPARENLSILSQIFTDLADAEAELAQILDDNWWDR